MYPDSYRVMSALSEAALKRALTVLRSGSWKAAMEPQDAAFSSPMKTRHSKSWASPYEPRESLHHKSPQVTTITDHIIQSSEHRLQKAG